MDNKIIRKDSLLYFKYLLLLIPITIFLWTKISSIAIYFSDTNVYFYISYLILKGKILYKDIWFTNLPLFPYISALYLKLVNGNIYTYLFSGAIEAAIASLLIFYIVSQKTKNFIFSALSLLLFLFSTVTLSNSTGQAGIFTAVLFLLLAYITFEKKKYLSTGILLAACFLTKIYFLPVILAFFIVTLTTKNIKHFLLLFMGFLVTNLIILTPFIIVSGKEMWFDIIQYSLIKKGEFLRSIIIKDFISTDFILFIVSIIALLRVHKDIFFASAAFFFYLFFFFNKSIFYLYLCMIVPFMSIYAGYLLTVLQNKFKLPIMIVPAIICAYVIYTFIHYYNSYLGLDKIDKYNQIVSEVNNDKPSYLYGTSFITTALSYSTGIPLLHESVDTDDALFITGVLNSKELTKEAIARKSDVIVWGRQYSDGNYIKREILNVAIDKELLYSKCKLANTYPFRGSYINPLFLFKCRS